MLGQAGIDDHMLRFAIAPTNLSVVYAWSRDGVYVSVDSGATWASKINGLLGYQAWIPELGVVANTLQWTTLWGDPLDYELEIAVTAPSGERDFWGGAGDFQRFLQTELTPLIERRFRQDREILEEDVEALLKTVFFISDALKSSQEIIGCSAQ